MASQSSNSLNSYSETTTIIEPIDKYTALAVRSAIFGTGLLGVALYLKNSRLFSRFKHVSHIPKKYYQNEIKLKGIVREITPSGLFKIEHVPVVRLFKKKLIGNENLLNFRLAGFDLSPEAITYLSKNLKLKNQSVCFNLLKRSDTNSDSADGIIFFKNNFFTYSNLNVNIVRKGLVKVYGPENKVHIDAMRNYSAYSRFITHLLTCEKVADQRGIGIWERSTWVEYVKSLPVSFVEIVKSTAITKLFVFLFQLLYDLCLLVFHLTKHGYYLSVSTISYIGLVYRRFAIGVERLSNFYSTQKNRLFSKKN